MDEETLLYVFQQEIDERKQGYQLDEKTICKAIIKLAKDYRINISQGFSIQDEDNSRRKSLKLSERAYNRIMFTINYLWYIGALADSLKPNKQPGWEKIVEIWNIEHPDDKANLFSMKQIYNSFIRRYVPAYIEEQAENQYEEENIGAKQYSAAESLIFPTRLLFDSHCRVALVNLFDGLHLNETREQLDSFFDGIVPEIRMGWEGKKQALNGDELISFSLAHWDDIFQYCGTLYFQTYPDRDREEYLNRENEYSVRLRQILEHFRESIIHNDVRMSPYKFKTPTYENLTNEFQPYDISVNEHFPLYFLQGGKIYREVS